MTLQELGRKPNTKVEVYTDGVVVSLHGNIIVAYAKREGHYPTLSLSCCGFATQTTERRMRQAIEAIWGYDSDAPQVSIRIVPRESIFLVVDRNETTNYDMGFAVTPIHAMNRPTNYGGLYAFRERDGLSTTMSNQVAQIRSSEAISLRTLQRVPAPEWADRITSFQTD